LRPGLRVAFILSPIFNMAVKAVVKVQRKIGLLGTC